jgi:Spy/CpxP family protein refolding chaperone
MRGQGRVFVAMLLLTVLGAGLAGWAGVEFGLHRSEHNADLDTILHRDLDLTSDQDRKLDALEAGFARDRESLQEQMRAANRDLAHAITVEHRFDPGARVAIDHFHQSMRILQERTVQHVLSMRALLTPEQQKRFDKMIDNALVAGSP